MNSYDYKYDDYMNSNYMTGINNMMKDNNFTNTLQTIFDLCESEGYHVENRIWLKDMKTGKVWK